MSLYGSKVGLISALYPELCCFTESLCWTISRISWAETAVMPIARIRLILCFESCDVVEEKAMNPIAPIVVEVDHARRCASSLQS